jgi:transcriptional regulator GlxA family with amidase domain
MEIAILLFEGVTALDAIGPYEVLASAPGADVKFVATETGMKRTHTGRLGLNADFSLAEVSRPDIIVIPGTPDIEAVTGDQAVLEWLREAHQHSKWTTSVCTGALALGAAGLLKGMPATTHWLAHDALKSFGASPTLERVVREGKIVTAAGVSSGIDMALSLVSWEFDDETARQIQLVMEYDPQPPFDSGSPTKASAETVNAVRQRAAA